MTPTVERWVILLLVGFFVGVVGLFRSNATRRKISESYNDCSLKMTLDCLPASTYCRKKSCEYRYVFVSCLQSASMLMKYSLKVFIFQGHRIPFKHTTYDTRRYRVLVNFFIMYFVVIREIKSYLGSHNDKKIFIRARQRLKMTPKNLQFPQFCVTLITVSLLYI